MREIEAAAERPLALDVGEPSIVRRFLAWAQRADAEGRAEAASALARAYLYSDLPPRSARRSGARPDGGARRSLRPGAPRPRRSHGERRRRAAPYRAGARLRSIGSGERRSRPLAGADRRRTRRLRRGRRLRRADRPGAASAPQRRRRGGARRNRPARSGSRSGGQPGGRSAHERACGAFSSGSARTRRRARPCFRAPGCPRRCATTWRRRPRARSPISPRAAIGCRPSAPSASRAMRANRRRSRSSARAKTRISPSSCGARASVGRSPWPC